MIAEGEHRVVVNGIEHWCRVAASDRRLGPLVIIHGGPGGNNYAFERTIGSLLEDFASVIYYDQRGSGRSAAPADENAYSIELLVEDLEKLRAAVEAPVVTPLGYSFGAEIAMAYALAYPDAINALIVQAPIEEDPAVAANVQLDGFRAVARDRTKGVIERILSSIAVAEDKAGSVWAEADTDLVDRFLFQDPIAARSNRELWRRSGLVNTGAMDRALRRSGERVVPRARLGAIAAPTLVLVGRHDRNCGVRPSEEVARRIPRAELRIFEESAHFPDIEEPAAYAWAVREFLAR